MATCPYCGQKAGFFSKYHEACFLEAEKDRKLGVEAIRAVVEAAFTVIEPTPERQVLFSNIVSRYRLSPDVVGDAVLGKVDELSRETPLETTAAEYLSQLCEDILGDSDKIPPKSHFYHPYKLTLLNVALSRNLWLVMHGAGKAIRGYPNPCDVVLQPGEDRLAEFGTVQYRKSVMVSSHTGGYNGIAVRVASGLYYRFGEYAGHTVSSQEVQYLDNGFFVLTNKSMYFAGQQTTFRVPYNSILRFKAYPDGLGFFRSIGAGREEIFTVVNPNLTPLSGLRYFPKNAVTLHVGWFLYNLVTFLTSTG